MKYWRLLLIPLWLLAMACATQTTPMGGPKDTIPPTVLWNKPKPDDRNFKGKEIVVDFDEAIQLNNPKDEIIIVPSLGKKTEFKLKNNSLIITPELPFRDSTTYNINFREGVKDLTEGNAAPDLHLAFSTGPDLDTAQISGTVRMSLSEKIPENITIALYSTDTFDIFEDTPEYFTKTNKEGLYKITNLKQGKYRLYAFEDKNKNLKAETKSEKFGFIADTLQIDSTHSGFAVYMVNIDTRKPKLSSVRNQSYVNTIRFNKSVTDYKFKTDHKFLSTFNNNQTEILAYYPDIQLDSIAVGLSAIDSTLQKIDTTIYIKRDKKERIKEVFKPSSGDATFNVDTQLLTYRMTFNKPLKSINKDSIYIRLDSVTVIPVPITSLKIDSIKNVLTLNEKVPIDSLPTSPRLTLANGFLVSIEDDSLKAINPTIEIIDQESTAIVTVDVVTKRPHYIIQLVSSNDEVIAEARNQKRVTFRYVKPGSLKIRAIVDRNNNGVWDTAIYPNNHEPEPVVYYLNSKKTSEVPLRANWDVDQIVIKF